MAEQQRAETGRSSARRVTPVGLAELLELSPDALVVVDQSGTIVQANAQVATLFGYSREEALGQPLEALLPERLRAIHAVHRQHYFTAPSARAMGTHLQLFGRRKDGREFPLDISLRPVLLDGDEDLLAVGAVRDMSEQRRAERERAEQAELIQLAHDALFTRDLGSRVIFWNKGAEALYGYSAQQAQGHISHSLLQTRFPVPLSEIEEHVEHDGLWEGELVQTCRDGRVVTVESRWSPVRDASGRVTARLDKLTEDLLDVTRLQAGRLVLSHEPTDLVTLVRKMLMQAQVTTKRHTFSFETPLTSLVVQVDRVRIEQVFSNLLGNAVKYSPQGGLIEVVLHAEVESHSALLSIRDQGIGIPASQQGRIFGRFVRAENARMTEIAGTGLGLYLSREVIEWHGGRLWFESEEGAGSTFFLTLPIT